MPSILPRRAAELARRLDSHPVLLDGARRARSWLPGDGSYGDPLSVAGGEPPQLLGRRLAALRPDQPSTARELAFSALQLWQGLSGPDATRRPLVAQDEATLLFTDLVGFSSFALEVGDAVSLELLRQVMAASEPLVSRHGGAVVKRLGDGLMAVFRDPAPAVRAALAMTDAVDRVEVGGHRLRQRAGLHVGRPQRLGGDYFGIDVNVAARVAAAAGPGQVLVSSGLGDRLTEESDLELRRKWRFAAKGVPAGTTVFAVTQL